MLLVGVAKGTVSVASWLASHLDLKLNKDMVYVGNSTSLCVELDTFIHPNIGCTSL
jgi:hypothetical protein